MEPVFTRHLLDRNELLSIEYIPASRGQRFANYLLDLVVFFILLAAFFFTMGLVQALLGSSQAEEAVDPSSDGVVETALFYSLYALYYVFFEALVGKTPGKMITKTHVIHENGQPISFGQALGRTLCRFIPFDALTFLLNVSGRGMHDSLPKTWVVQDLPAGPTRLQSTEPGPETE